MPVMFVPWSRGRQLFWRENLKLFCAKFLVELQYIHFVWEPNLLSNGYIMVSYKALFLGILQDLMFSAKSLSAAVY